MIKFRIFLIIVLSVIFTVNLWFLSKPPDWTISQMPFRSLGQMLALLGFVLTSITIVMSVKLPIVEKFTGGLDKSLFIHHLLGSVGFVLLLQHPMFLAIQYLPNFQIAKSFFIPGADFNSNLGIAALFLMIMAFIFMIFIKLPYQFWLSSHRFLAIAFIIGSLHSLLIPSDTSQFLPLKLWVLFFALLGIFAGIYSVILHQKFGPQAKYVVENIERILDIVHIYLKPEKAPIQFKPGQFVYVKFNNTVVGTELHPFSMSSSPREDVLRLSIKILGDYTLKLVHLNNGDRVSVFGPHGTFGNFLNQTHSEVWIAGGIGVTPFISMIRDRIINPSKYPFVTFFYATKSSDEAVFLDEIKSMIANDINVRLVPWFSNTEGKLTGERVGSFVDLKSIDRFLFCGPEKMMEDLKKQFIKNNIPEEKIFYESFSFL